jgi:hypothetical protein
MMESYSTRMEMASCNDATHLQAGEANQVGAQTETGALACRQSDARGQQVQQSEGHRGDNADSQDLLQVQLLLRDDEGSQCHGQTLQEILNHASHQLSNNYTVHSYNRGSEKFHTRGPRLIWP